MSWHRGPLLALDFESTGLDTETARIVTATLVDIQPGCAPTVHNWLVSPGVPIPDEAAAVHGVTSEMAEAKGVPPVEALGQLGSLLGKLWNPSVPLIAYNVVYDATLFDRELRRHGWPGGFELRGPVVDGLVIDKHVDRYRRGSRKLIDTCAHLGIALSEEDAHSSAADALAAARIAWVLASRNPTIGGATLEDLQTMQATWYAEQATSLAAHFRKQADKAKDVDEQIKFMARANSITTDWPIRPHASELQAGVA